MTLHSIPHPWVFLSIPFEVTVLRNSIKWANG
nr:MAG TPA: hypothetical protein [Caudoviricetes sp.]